ncbi:probable DNA alkylation repair enzyme [hydrothermal vent metagenome]|uniref:Probable DNA alkylation repair enzyme n=1 Tax=hydrothermal vent metagenome TaxID=652676 RepID=A0A3B0ZH94_9ZZZZ
MDYQEIISKLDELANTKIAKNSQRFFKTEKGEYGYGDKFLGIRVPVLRKIAKSCRALTTTEIKKLIKSEFHETRLLALLILVDQYSQANEDKKEIIYKLYLKHTKYINNWDLVDTSAHYIVGAWLIDKDRTILYELANSAKLWERRIAIMSTFFFIKNGEFTDTLNLSKVLIDDTEDLIHKAVGWMLREIGNRDQKEEEKYLKQHYKQMPRTMLRYSIEKFSKEHRQKYLKGRV